MKQSEATITENFAEILSSIETKVMNRLRVGTLARVLAVNERLLTVQPIIMEKINTPTAEKYIKLPEIHNVYCISGQYPKVNDYVICVHLDKGADDLDIFKTTDKLVRGNGNKHNINDCVAIVIKTTDEEQPSDWRQIVNNAAKQTIYNLGKAKEVRFIVKDDTINNLYYFSDIFFTSEEMVIQNTRNVNSKDRTISCEINKNVDGEFILKFNEITNCAVEVYAK